MLMHVVPVIVRKPAMTSPAIPRCAVMTLPAVKANRLLPRSSLTTMSRQLPFLTGTSAVPVATQAHLLPALQMPRTAMAKAR